MIQLLSDQKENDKAFKRWVNALIERGVPSGKGWVIQGTGFLFSNYGHGSTGTIENEVMLGVDDKSGNGVVKLVCPDTSQTGPGKQTAIGRDAAGRIVLLREGRLQKNHLSAPVTKTEFARLTGLSPVQVAEDGKGSKRQWFLVAVLGANAGTIVDETVEFATACAVARAKMGGSQTFPPVAADVPSFGADEQGRLITVKITGGTKEVERLQGYVWDALKAKLGDALTKPKKSGYEVDGVIANARLLLEIKTGVSAAEIYAAVGQLILYPTLVDVPATFKKILLVPDTAPIGPIMSAALQKSGIETNFYSVDRIGKKPRISFHPGFLKRCRTG